MPESRTDYGIRGIETLIYKGQGRRGHIALSWSRLLDTPFDATVRKKTSVQVAVCVDVYVAALTYCLKGLILLDHHRFIV